MRRCCSRKNQQFLLEKLEKMGCDEASRNFVKSLCLEYELSITDSDHENALLRVENEQLKGIINKHCLGKTVISVCYGNGRNTGYDDCTSYEEMHSYPCCDDDCKYLEIGEWEKEFRVDIKKLKRDHEAQTSTPLYTETDPSPTLPDDNDE